MNTEDVHFHPNSLVQRHVLPQRQKSTIHPWAAQRALIWFVFIALKGAAFCLYCVEGSSLQDQMLRMPGFLHWWDCQEPQHKTDWTQTGYEKWWCQQSHCCTSLTLLASVMRMSMSDQMVSGRPRLEKNGHKAWMNVSASSEVTSSIFLFLIFLTTSATTPRIVRHEVQLLINRINRQILE